MLKAPFKYIIALNEHQEQGTRTKLRNEKSR